jgi:predicted phosphodiesterase
MAQRFVHLSDLHFGQEKHGTLPKHEAVRKAILKDLNDLAARRGAAVRILITGDVAFSGKVKEFEAAAQWLDELTRVCGCKEADISTIPGNHDCDRDEISASARIIYGVLRSGSPQTAQAHLADMTKDGDSTDLFFPKLHAYRKFASAYGCDIESAKKPCWTKDIDLSRGVRLRLYGLTSVNVSNDEDAPGKMLLGSEQYIFEEEENVIAVVMLHHPFNWYMDKDEAERYLCNRAHVIMTGHEHALNVQKVRDSMSGHEWFTIYAGATNPPEAELKFTYNWLEFDCEQNDEAVNLVMEAFPRVWVPEKACFEADRNRLPDGAESIREEIACRNFRMSSEPEGVASEPQFVDPVAQLVRVPGSAIPRLEREVKGEGGVGMITDDAGFDRLRYLFWRYLDWQQRLKVLVKVDALPMTVDQPLPQTLERVALDSAATDREKLHKLWDEIMPLIPTEKRDINPF